MRGEQEQEQVCMSVGIIFYDLLKRCFVKNVSIEFEGNCGRAASSVYLSSTSNNTFSRILSALHPIHSIVKGLYYEYLPCIVYIIPLKRCLFCIVDL